MERQSGDSGCLNKNLYVMLRFTERPRTLGDHFKNTWLSLKGTSCVQVICVLIWMNQTLIYFNLQKGGTVNGLSNIMDTSTESFQLQKSVLHQRTCIFKKAVLSISYEDWGKYKEKVPDVSDPNQNIETTWNSKLKFT